MRAKLAIAVALCLALVVPAGASGAQPSSTSNFINTVGYFTSEASPTETYYWVLGLNVGLSHDLAQQPEAVAAFDVQMYHFKDGAWLPSFQDGVDLTADQYRFSDLTHAWVDVGLLIDGRTIHFDIAWIGLGPGETYMESGDTYTWVGKRVDAHVTGTIQDPDGILSIGDVDQTSAILRSQITH